MCGRKKKGGEARDNNKTDLNTLCFINFTLNAY